VTSHAYARSSGLYEAVDGLEVMCSVMCLSELLPDSRDRSMHAPLAPLSANAVRNSFPKPLAAPVTTQVFPSREKEGRVMRERRVVVSGLRKRQRRAVVERSIMLNEG